MLSHLTFILHDSAKEALGVRIKKRKKGVKLPKQIIDLIKQKTKFQEEMRTAGGASGTTVEFLHKIEKLKRKIKDGIGDFTMKKRNRMRAKLLQTDKN